MNALEPGLVCLLQIGALLGERHLDGGGAPADELRQLPLSDPLEALVHLCGVHVALDDVQDGDVDAAARGAGHHDVLCVEQAPHHIQHRGLLDGGHLSVDRQGCVARHEEVAFGRRDQGRQHSDPGISLLRPRSGHASGQADLLRSKTIQMSRGVKSLFM